MAIVPGIQNLLFGVVVNLGGEGVLIGEWQAWDGFSVGVGVISIVHLTFLLVVHIDGVQDTTDDEAVSVGVSLEACSPGCFLFQRQVSRIQFTDDDHLLLVVVVVNGRVDHPQATFVHCKVNVRVAPPFPGGGVLVNHVMQQCPGRHISHPQIILDDVLGEGSIVVEGSIINHMACAYPVVRQFEEVAPSAYDKQEYYISFIIIYYKAWVNTLFSFTNEHILYGPLFHLRCNCLH